MKGFIKFCIIGLICFSLFSCNGKNPVAGKKMALNVGDASYVYIFEKDQFYMEGLEGYKLNYQYDIETNTIIYTEFDGSEKTLDCSQLTEVK